MAPPTRCNYVKGVVICHGKSELLMTRHITSNLHLNVKPYARDKGSNSIQITSLMTVLKLNHLINLLHSLRHIRLNPKVEEKRFN